MKVDVEIEFITAEVPSFLAGSMMRQPGLNKNVVVREGESDAGQGQGLAVAVYVDTPAWQLGRMKMCHMLADNVDELHAMADRIGIRRKWFQNSGIPHYDVCKSKRKLAIRLGAVEIDRRQTVTLIRRLRGVI